AVLVDHPKAHEFRARCNTRDSRERCIDADELVSRPRIRDALTKPQRQARRLIELPGNDARVMRSRAVSIDERFELPRLLVGALEREVQRVQRGFENEVLM